MIKVSIIIPTYNRQNLILRTLNSVFNQFYKNIEVIVIDDGSTDNTGGILKTFVDNNKLIYQYQNNLGRSIARNEGIKLASGDFLMFLDSDDSLEPDAISTLVKLHEKFPQLNIFAASYRLIEEDILGNKNEIYTREHEFINENILLQQVKMMVLNVGNNIIRKTLIEKYGGFEAGLEYAEDWSLLVSVCSKEKAVVIKKVILNVLRHDNNSSFFHIQDAIIKISKGFIIRIKENDFILSNDINKKQIIAELNKRIAMAYNRKGEKLLSLNCFINALTSYPVIILQDLSFIKEFVFLFVPTKLLLYLRRIQLKMGSRGMA